MSNHAALIRSENSGKTVIRRGRQYIEFDQGNGIKRFVATVDPLHYGPGNDQEIDTTWQVDTGAWQWRLLSNNFQLHARSVLNAGDIIQWLDTRSGESVTMQPLALNWVDNVTNSRQQLALPQAVTATANDAQLTWTNGYGPGIHFKFAAHPLRLFKEFVIDSPSALPAPTVQNPYLEVEFILSRSAGVALFVDGQEWDNATQLMTAKRIEFRLPDGTVAWLFEAPSARDAGGNITPGIFQLRRQGANRYCTIRFPKAWVDSAQYPIILDPTYTDGYLGDIQTYCDTYVNQGAPTTTVGTGTTLWVRAGTTSFCRNTLIKYNLAAIPAGSTCNTATHYLYITSTGAANHTCNFYTILAANSDWVETEVCWNYKYGTTNWAGGASGCDIADTDRGSSSLGSFSIASGDAANTEKSCTLTNSVIATWFGGSGSNYGILLKSDADATAQFSSSSSPFLWLFICPGICLSDKGCFSQTKNKRKLFQYLQRFRAFRIS